MLYLIIPIFLLYLLWLFCVHMDEKVLSRHQTKGLPQKELSDPSEPEQNKSDKTTLSIRDFYYRFRRSDEEEEPEQNLKKKRKPEEPPHDHQEDQQQDPPPALRERRRPLVRLREDEEEDEEDQSTQTEPSPVQDSSVQTDKVMTVESGTQDKRRTEDQHQLPDEDITDALIIKKDAEAQTSIFQSDKGVEAYPKLKDEEVQISPVREDRSAQAMPETRDIGTGEWLALQKSIGVGNHLETIEKGVGDRLETEDRGIQANPTQEDKSVQEEPENESRGVGSPNPSFHNKSLQINPEAEDKSIQKDVSKRSAEVQYIPRKSIDILIEDLEGSPKAKSIFISNKGSEKKEEEDNHNPFGDNGSFHLSRVKTVKSIMLNNENEEHEKTIDFIRNQTISVKLDNEEDEKSLHLSGIKTVKSILLKDEEEKKINLSGIKTVKSEPIKDEDDESIPEFSSISPLSSIKSKKIEEDD